MLQKEELTEMEFAFALKCVQFVEEIISRREFEDLNREILARILDRQIRPGDISEGLVDCRLLCALRPISERESCLAGCSGPPIDPHGKFGSLFPRLFGPFGEV